MSEVYMLQPVTSACDLFATSRRRSYVAEPDLDELMRDPMTVALMAADGIDRRELDALLRQAKDNLR
jgi:hypothetical protein